MPYSTPSQGRPGHRRSYSHIAQAFVSSTPALPGAGPMTTPPRSPPSSSATTTTTTTLPTRPCQRTTTAAPCPLLRLKLKPSPFDAVPFPRTASPAPRAVVAAVPPCPLPVRGGRLPGRPAPRPPVRLPHIVHAHPALQRQTPQVVPQELLVVPQHPLPAPVPRPQHHVPRPPRPPPARPLRPLYPASRAHRPRLRLTPVRLDSPSPTYFPQKNVHFPSQEEGGLAPSAFSTAPPSPLPSPV